ncbi:fungal hydrophobin-domain-containing protein [Collybia nuda]|uniref:Hydrophobin n=1 Tax=Collybia nuda TaxID=64659 RepID=A0A9P5YBG1_9AGAR|nr:fungal hydrophobin-domain-containing protein [Collybia nuda]
MFARTSTVVVAVLALPLLAAATVLPRTTTPTTPASQCNTSNISCCNSSQESSALTGPVAALLGLLGIDIGSITGIVGLTCSPLTIIGGGGSSCTAQPVCCSNNSFHGVVAIGCTPINVNL